MKQLHLQGVTRFPSAPIEASDSAVTSCRTEDAAVRWCIEFARVSRGLNQRAISKLCGWDRPSFLCEIASAGSPKTMPESRVRKFTLATGCCLLEQFLKRQADERDLAGKKTEADRTHDAVALLVAQARSAGFDRRDMERAA